MTPALLQQAQQAVQQSGPETQHSFKACAVCGHSKSTEEYRPVSSSPDGFAISCLACEQVRCACAFGLPLVWLAALGTDASETVVSRCSPARHAWSQEQARSAHLAAVTGTTPTEKACSRCHVVQVSKHSSLL